MNILQEIFADHYEKILLTFHPRATEIENIDRMINCGDPSYGGTMYACTKYGRMKFVPFRRHSRFYPPLIFFQKDKTDITVEISTVISVFTHTFCPTALR